MKKNINQYKRQMYIDRCFGSTYTEIYRKFIDEHGYSLVWSRIRQICKIEKIKAEL